MRDMYDSTTAADIPRTAEMVGGYDDGLYDWTPADWNLFPDAVHISFTVFPQDNMGDVLDVEIGDAKPEDAPGWVQRRKAAGLARPAIYCNAATWGAVITQMEQAGIHGFTDYIIASWNGLPHQFPGSIGTQYASPETGSGGHYDLSVIYDDSWHSNSPTPAPVPAPAPDPLEEAIMSFPDVGTNYPDRHTVRKVQGLLCAFGWSLNIDGIFGPVTASCVREFQRQHGLSIDGVFGPLSCAAAISG
jgi:peptidoglycan hydrolase-like protein with peptidoglycan-binding domain